MKHTNLKKPQKIAFVLALLMIFVSLPLSAFAVQANYSGELENGTYYFNNKRTGKYMYNSSGTISYASGLISELGNTIQWKLTLIADNQYIIQSAANLNLYLTASSDTSTTTIYLQTLTGSSIPEWYKWTIDIAPSSSGCIVQNLHTGKYLFNNNVGIRTSSLGLNERVQAFRTWFIVKAENYGTSSSSLFMELPSYFKFKTLTLFAGDSSEPKETIFTNSDKFLWSSADHFTFSGYNTTYVTLDEYTGVFTASTTLTTLYTATITATHKATGRTSNFSLVINPQVALVGVDSITQKEDGSPYTHDHTTSLDMVAALLSSSNYSNTNVYTGEFLKVEIDSYLNLDSNSIFISRSHGGIHRDQNGVQVGTRLLLNDPHDSDPYVYYSSNQMSGSLDLSNMELIMFIGCETGAGGEDGFNLPAVAVELGAQTAVGFSSTIYCESSNLWLVDFMELMLDGGRVDMVCSTLANEDLYKTEQLQNYVICGVKGTTIVQ